MPPLPARGGGGIAKRNSDGSCRFAPWRDAADFFTFIGLHMNAVDGAPNVASLTGGRVTTADLSVPQHFPRADWVLSLEVAEHIPRAREHVFVRNVIEHAKTGIVLSWASPSRLPRKYRHFHPNEKEGAAVVALMQHHGLRYDANATELLQAAAGAFCCAYFKHTIGVFLVR